MGPIRRIVVATDFSAGSDAAVERALQVARAHAASLELLHVFDVSAWHSLRAVFDTQRLVGEVPQDLALRDRLRALADSLAEQTQFEVSASFEVGDAVPAIEAHVKKTGAALLVLGVRADPEAPGLGSTALKLLRAVPCPVLVVRPYSTQPYGNILSAVDMRDVSERVADTAVTLFPAARHRLFFAVDPQWQREVWRATGAQSAMQSMHESLHAQAVHHLDQLAKTLSGKAEHTVIAEVVESSPVHAVVARAESLPADCVAVGHHGQGLLAERLLGSTAQDLIHHTARDVLVVP